jgi:hypothetical protein
MAPRVLLENPERSPRLRLVRATRRGDQAVTTFIYTASECLAFRYMVCLKELPNMDSTDPPDPHECANWFIAFAERIKAERSVVAMEARP